MQMKYRQGGLISVPALVLTLLPALNVKAFFIRHSKAAKMSRVPQVKHGDTDKEGIQVPDH